MGGVVYMSRYGTKLFQGSCIHNEGYLKGVKLQPEPVKKAAKKVAATKKK